MLTADAGLDISSLYSAFASVVFLVPYMLMFGVFLKLRFADADRARPYKVPGGNVTATILTIICLLFITQAILFFNFVPGDFDPVYAGSIIGGLIVIFIVGEILILRAAKTKKSKIAETS